jgi:hypothetical protein
MKCHECGKEMRLLHGYAVTDPNVGAIKTDGEYWECPDPACGVRLVPAATAQKVDDVREDRIGKMLWRIASDPREFAEKFILAKDVAKILNVTRQAVEKSVYAKAMTYNTVIGKVRYWLKESVERYKNTGNGKFPLARAEDMEQDIRLREADFGKPDTSWLPMVISQKQTNGQTINISTISTQKTGEACKGKKTKTKASFRKSSRNRQTSQYSSTYSTSQGIQRIRYSIYPHATGLTEPLKMTKTSSVLLNTPA